MYPYSNFPLNMSYAAPIGETMPLFIWLVSIYGIPTARSQHLVFSAVCKSLVFTMGVLCMSTGGAPDPLTFQRFHDFYSIRIVSHFDPQFEDTSIAAWQHLISTKGCMGHLTKLVFLITSCVWFGRLLDLRIFSYKSTTLPNSKNEVVVVGTIISVMVAALAVSKQHYHSMHVHSIAMLWAIWLTVGCCIIVVAVCSRPFKVDTVSSLVSSLKRLFV